MEIQSQTASTALTGSVAGGSAAVAASTSGGKAAGGFATALNGMLVATVSPAGSTGSGTGAENALLAPMLQMLAPLLALVQTGEEQTPQTMLDQLKQLIQGLTKADDKLSDELVSDPAFQALLAQLQALLASLNVSAVTTPADTAADVTADADASSDETIDVGNTETGLDVLNPLLFVPITDAAASNGDSEEGNVQQLAPVKPFSKEEALQLLTQLQEVALSGKDNPAVAEVLKQLPAVMNELANGMKQALIAAQTNGEDAGKTAESSSPAAAQMAATAGNVEKKGASSHTAAHETKDTKQSAAKGLVQVVPTAIQKLEPLTAKATPLFVVKEAAPEQELLFEPLDQAITTDAPDAGNQTISVQDLMKQSQPNHTAPKAPVLQMPAQAFAEETAKFIVNSFSLQSSGNGLTEAKISLFPQHLGQVDVRLTMHNGQLIAHFMADSAAGKEILESQLAQLRTTLQSQGIQVERLEVSQSQGYFSGMFQENRQQQQQSSGKQQKAGAAKVSEADEELLETTLSNAAQPSAGQASSIDVTA